MVSAHHLRRSSHRFTFPSLLAASKNSIAPIYRVGQNPSIWLRSVVPQRYYPATPLRKTGRSIARLVLSAEDKAFIKSKFTRSIPKRLRSENDVLDALREHGYVPAIDRVDEMLDQTRSPHQTIDEFDKITLGLLMRTAKTVDGGIRNPYKIPGTNTGQNPILMKNRKLSRPSQIYKWFLFPDDTNWTYIYKYFPLPEPPRPWHPIVMQGFKQEYSKEEVARRLEWSMVQNAKKLRNGYHYPPPDPAKYEVIRTLPSPPPPVIRTCNVCKKPRYLLRFWNFYYQRWQHVSSPHRPGDCDGHKRGTSGRLMYAPPKTKIGSKKASQVEDKEWIDEETAVKILFRSNLLNLPSVNPEIGKIFAKASRCPPEPWPWAPNGEGDRWAMRGGRMNGLVDLSNVKESSELEKERTLQTERFKTEHNALFRRIEELMEAHPITAEQAVALPPGQMYPADHPVVELWKRWESQLYRRQVDESVNVKKKKQALQKALDAKIIEYDATLEQLKKTEAELLMMESGQGESWVDPSFIKLHPRDRIELLEKGGDIVEETDWYPSERPRQRPENATPIYSKMPQEEYLLRYKLERGSELTDEQRERLERRLHVFSESPSSDESRELNRTTQDERPLETQHESAFSKWDSSDALINRLKELQIARHGSADDLVLIKPDPRLADVQEDNKATQDGLSTASAENEAKAVEKNDST
ncbi:hypothetical protein AA313_de0205215 [Arthrobotrys entomopaga]|nr:hypothetical protein AA313_de0205215 [Arthrobotrys entomopaga]